MKSQTEPLSKDAIVDIAPQQIRFFGTPGKMLLPSRATVEANLKTIPKGHLLTTDLLRKQMAEQFNVQGTCPVTTKKVLRAIANQPHQKAPYWRVVKQNGELMDYYPNGLRGHATLLKKEGLVIDTQGKKPKVKALKDHLVHNEQV